MPKLEGRRKSLGQHRETDRVRQTLVLAEKLFIPFTENDAFLGLSIR